MRVLFQRKLAWNFKIKASTFKVVQQDIQIILVLMIVCGCLTGCQGRLCLFISTQGSSVDAWLGCNEISSRPFHPVVRHLLLPRLVLYSGCLLACGESMVLSTCFFKLELPAKTLQTRIIIHISTVCHRLILNGTHLPLFDFNQAPKYVFCLSENFQFPHLSPYTVAAIHCILFLVYIRKRIY